VEAIDIKGRHYWSYPPGQYLGYAERILKLDTADTAFVIVDVYGASLGNRDDDGPGIEYMLDRALKIVIERIAPGKAAAKRLGIPSICVTNSAPRVELSRSELGNQRQDNVSTILDALSGECINDPLGYVPGDLRCVQHSLAITAQNGDCSIRKHVYSGFFGTRLDGLPRNLGIRNIVFSGLAAGVCLLGTMIDALYRNCRVLLLRDCTEAVDVPGFDQVEGAFTRRICLWTECHLGHTFTSADWVAACATTAGSRSSGVA
jgi:nicotinamidase-related amidase